MSRCFKSVIPVLEFLRLQPQTGRHSSEGPCCRCRRSFLHKYQSAGKKTQTKCDTTGRVKKKETEIQS